MAMDTPVPKTGSRLLGPFCLSLLSFPYIYNYLQQTYWTARFRRLNMNEIISDRMAWLHQCMLHDEIERTVLKQASNLKK
ncbi:uncharacterized protein BdWA1_003554 [Babesia duncani]|uniref:Uncharacterized protein n=1 Tax=Babesia duncani TaxID=323732 RepID=A0AAD9PHI3_9APIC|nr:hypothetical protein BdWA1_003554 [Babesia duncani]